LEIAVKTVLRVVLWILMGTVALAGILAALAGYFLYTPNPELPRLSGTVAAGSIVINGQKRTYQAYAPRGLAPGAPLVLAMHGSGENGTAMRIETGYAFERLADERGFAVVYPNGQNGHWNTCEIDKDAEQPDVDPHSIRWRRGKPVIRPHEESQRSFNIRHGTSATKIANSGPSSYLGRKFPKFSALCREACQVALPL